MDSRAQPSASLDLATGEGAVPFASTGRRQHLTADERIARVRAARHQAPRSSHGRWEPAPDRPDPVALLEEQADLAATPVSGVTVQLCGDAHVSNFGTFGTPERRMLFDINDFAQVGL